MKLIRRVFSRSSSTLKDEAAFDFMGLSTELQFLILSFCVGMRKYFKLRQVSVLFKHLIYEIEKYKVNQYILLLQTDDLNKNNIKEIYPSFKAAFFRAGCQERQEKLLNTYRPIFFNKNNEALRLINPSQPILKDIKAILLTIAVLQQQYSELKNANKFKDSLKFLEEKCQNFDFCEQYYENICRTKK